MQVGVDLPLSRTSAAHALAGGASVSQRATTPPLSPWPATRIWGKGGKVVDGEADSGVRMGGSRVSRAGGCNPCCTRAGGGGRACARNKALTARCNQAQPTCYAPPFPIPPLPPPPTPYLTPRVPQKVNVRPVPPHAVLHPLRVPEPIGRTDEVLPPQPHQAPLPDGAEAGAAAAETEGGGDAPMGGGYCFVDLGALGDLGGVGGAVKGG